MKEKNYPINYRFPKEDEEDIAILTNAGYSVSNGKVTEIPCPKWKIKEARKELKQKGYKIRKGRWANP